MSKERSAMKVKLNSFDDLFGANAPAASDQIVNVALSELYTFQNHPFKVNDDIEGKQYKEIIKEGMSESNINRLRKRAIKQII